LSYKLNRQWGMTLSAEHEELESKDWALDGLEADSLPAVLTLGAVSPDYRVTVVRLLANYQF
jgi:hypothetical protein